MNVASSRIALGGMEIIILLIFGAIFAIPAGYVAKKKGYNFAAFAALGFFTGLIGLIIVAVLPDKNSKSISDSAATAQALTDYKRLLDDGVITQEEFDAKKRELLG